MYLPDSVSFILCVIRITVHNVSAYQCKALSSELYIYIGPKGP